MGLEIDSKKKHNKYLIDLEKKRSVIALLAGIAVFMLTMAAISVMVERYIGNDEHPLHYFTVLSNFFAATGAAFMIPYAVDGIIKKRFSVPHWVVLFQFSGANCVAITLVTSLAIILPVQGSNAIQGPNFWLHVVTPALTVILFQCVETGKAFTLRESVIALIPYWTYMAVYFIMVIVIGEDRGGWSDFYFTTAFCPAWASVMLMLILGLVVSVIMRKIQNLRAKQSRARISRLWSDGLDDVQLLIEAFGLGRHMGSRTSENEFSVPIDIFEFMSERYDIPLDKLVSAYMKGALDALKERGIATDEQ